MFLRSSVLSLLLFIFLPGVASAQTNVAVVQIDKILTQSKAGKNIQKQVEAKQKELQNLLETKQKEFDALQEDLVEESKKEDKSGFEEKRKDFQEKYAEEQRALQTERQALDRGVAVAMAELRSEMDDVVEEMAKEKKLDLVVTNQSTLWARKNVDITDEIIKALNKSVQEIAVKAE